MLKKYCSALLLLLLIGAMILPCAVSCAVPYETSTDAESSEKDTKKEEKTDTPESETKADKVYANISEMVADRVNSKYLTDFEETEEVTNYVKISVPGHGDIILELLPDLAPETVKNFQKLVSEGFYNGLTFHRVMQNFMIQGGDPKGNGTGYTDQKIKGEFTDNGFKNDLKHLRGVLSMARGKDNNSASCQFFICDTSNPHLDGKYATFGYVIAGLGTIDSITSVSVGPTAKGEQSVPKTPIVMEKVCFVRNVKDAQP